MLYSARQPAGWTRRKLIGVGTCVLGTVAVVLRPNAVAAESKAIVQPGNATVDEFIKRAFEMRDLALSTGDQGYGALIVDLSSMQIVGQSPSRVVSNGDPTGHAEMEAVRDATRRLGRRDLSNNVMYSSSKPCPMCEAAAYWANIQAYYYGANGTDGGSPRLCGCA